MERRTLKGEATRTRLIIAAIDLFAKNGFNSTSFDAIAKKCNPSHAATFKYFRDKDELIVAGIQYVVDSNHQYVNSLLEMTDNGFETLCKYFEGNLLWALHNPEQSQMIILLYYYSCFNDRFKGTYQVIRDNARNRILRSLLAGQREGIFNFKCSPRSLSEFLHDSILGYLVNLMTVSRPIQAEIEPFVRTQVKAWKAQIKPLLNSQ